MLSPSPRQLARTLAAAWTDRPAPAALSATELEQRRDTLLALEAAAQDGTRGRFPGTALLLDYQAELAIRARRRSAATKAAAAARVRPAAGPYSAAVGAVVAQYQPGKYSTYA